MRRHLTGGRVAQNCKVSEARIIETLAAKTDISFMCYLILQILRNAPVQHGVAGA